MGSLDYTDAVNGALDRLRSTGFYIGDFFANHGPMAAEAMAKLGYCEEVDGWVDANIASRNYGPPTVPTDAIIDPSKPTARSPHWPPKPSTSATSTRSRYARRPCGRTTSVRTRVT